MSRNIIELDKPIYRRIGALTVRISREGVAVRGKGKRRWHEIDWDAVLSMLPVLDRPCLAESERSMGRKVRRELVARPGQAMQIVDAGDGEQPWPGQLVLLQSPKCKHTADWQVAPTNWRRRDWRMCPKCN